MIIQLWGSWLVLFLIARLLGGAVMILAMIIMAALPGDRDQRFAKLIQNNGRGMYALIGVVLLIALVGVYFVSQWWFAMIEFTPVASPSSAVSASLGSLGCPASSKSAKISKSKCRRCTTMMMILKNNRQASILSVKFSSGGQSQKNKLSTRQN
ncbi:hypothetical protein [Lacticaseibacillus manihotivorans]|uniref:hypothetical protein n=1 Tax=Lacticaseibacillus manihotivorans TaxID=88233 RepID=UPI0006D18E61|nr:hypothetical protein [Lacticaseibacillus manihotivorans]